VVQSALTRVGSRRGAADVRLDAYQAAYLAWDGRALGSTGYHRWILRALPEGGTHVITEEVQTGLAARAIAPLMRRGVLREHQHWITQLGRRAATPEDTAP